jgi:long-chain acyl-CoA synthetase
LKLPAFLAAHARATPQREAVACGAARLSFAQLDEQSTRLALGFAEHGVGLGERIAIFLGNRIEFLVAFVAVVKAGAIAVTPNPRSSSAELGHILGDCRPRAVLFDGETRAVFERSGAQTAWPINIDSSLPELMRTAQGKLPEVPPEFDDCMIAYTSGTTGKPKGAIITQANWIACNAFLNAWQWGMTAHDRVLTTTPLAHRTAFSRFMNTLCLGSSMVVMPRFDAKEAARLIEAEGITLLGMVPTVGRMLLPEIESDPARFKSLRLAVVTGEAFPVEVKRRLAAALPQLKLFSFFAMTEVGAVTSLGPDEQAAKGASVGRPNPGVELKLMDEAGIEVAGGATGEIWVRSGAPGRYVTMRGYFNNPQADAETMREGWVRTGDLGRFDEDGYLYIVDRKKDMVLSGGYNIYSKEVEAAILELDGVQDAAVVGVPDAVYGEAVAAFIELRPGARLDAEQVVEHCRSRIASYKKPKHVRFVASLPRNISGKVLKYALREQFN